MQIVRDIMCTSVVTIPPNALIEHALDVMLEHHISGLPVVNEDDCLVGVISEYDALLLLTEARKQFWPVDPVEGFMTINVESVDEEMQLDQLAALFHNKSVRRLPVLRDGKLVGIVSRRDLIRSIRDDRKAEAQLPLDFTTGEKSLPV